MDDGGEAGSPLPFERIAFLGFGLIGGSIAMALRDSRLHLAAWTPAGRGPAVALESGLLDAAPPDAAATLDGSDLVVLAGPPVAILETLDELAGPLRGALGSALVTDVASTKAAIMARAGGHGLRFVGGHPMAGRETTGVEAATPELFAGRPWAVVAPAGADSADVGRIEALARATGATPVRMAAADHDAAAATISHVPLLASVALVEAMTADRSWQAGAAATLRASGWRDATRLAAGSPEMGAGIVATNTVEIAPRLRAFRDAVDRWIAELERAGGPDPDGIRQRLEAARSALAGPADS
jgi:prephenate dehydrogenase